MDFIAGPPVCGRIVADILRESLRLKLLKGGNMETEKVLDERMPAETANQWDCENGWMPVIMDKLHVSVNVGESTVQPIKFS